MKPSIAIWILVAVSSIASSTAQAQPLARGRLGRNPPGPWRYTRPLPRPYYYPYSSSYYYTYPKYYYTVPYSTYPSPTYTAPTYVTPSVDYSASTTSPPVAANAVPVTNYAPAVGGTFTLTNTPSNGGPIRYSLNNFTYTMNPGESQSVQLDRDWVITFDSGFNKTMRYRMEPGRYEFIVSPEAGWNVVRHVSAVPGGSGVMNPGELSPSDVNPALNAPLP
ncbi:MAG: hypothetical protein ACTHK7_18215 [Aureliella sp.]